MSHSMPAGQAGPPWWHGAVIYQLYVRSWQDSNGDGYGDLRGIIERLDHLAWLGVDAVWLSPTMPSPDEDWGYDVSDYTGVHPELGTLADLDELIAQAGQRNMRVLLDLVPNHTSSAHPWFADAASGRQAAHRGWYVWADPKPDGGPPNNWLDFTGRPAWQWHESGQYYLHNFLPGQPDLNWWEPAVHLEFRRILEFWFERGVAGFRIDVANGLYKDAELRDNPPLGDGGPMDGVFGLRFVYNNNRPRDARRLPRLAQDRGELLPRPAAARRDLGPGRGAAGRLLRRRRRAAARLQLPVRLLGFRARPGWPGLSSRRWPPCRPAGARYGWVPTTTWAGSPAAGAAATSARPGSRCWCWPPCLVPACSTTATRSP